jgi:hypothetical protein
MIISANKGKVRKRSKKFWAFESEAMFFLKRVVSVLWR